MLRPLYAVRDEKTGFGQPFIDVNDQSAIRGFVYAVKANPMQLGNCKDFDLFKIGDYDDETGLLIPCDKKSIFEGVNLKKEASDEV